MLVWRARCGHAAQGCRAGCHRSAGRHFHPVVVWQEQQPGGQGYGGKVHGPGGKVVRVNAVRTQIRTLFFKARNAQRIATLYETEPGPQAARSMEIAEVWYREGESSFTDFIETQSVWYNFQLALARAKADYGINLARLERMAGTHLTGEVQILTQPAGREYAMKILRMVLTGMALIWATGLAACAYRDLKQDMDAYAPPAIIQPAQASTPPVTGEPDAFEAETATIATLRDRWESVVGETAAAAGGADAQPAMIEAATDDARSLGLLRPRFSLQTVQSLILLRSPSIKARNRSVAGGLGGIRPGYSAGRDPAAVLGLHGRCDGRGWAHARR